MNKTKFTLVELLTVITVIAILMGILLPSLAAVRSKGRKAQCISNLKQMGLMSQQYVQDYKGFLPPMNHKVFEFLLPYYIDPKTKKEHGNLQVIDCPSEIFATADFKHEAAKDRRLEYGVNAYDYDTNTGDLDGNGDPSDYLPGIRGIYLSRIRDQFNVIHITDADPFQDPWDIGGANSGTREWTLRSHAPYRHKKYYNALYLDGHAVSEPSDTPNHESWAVPAKIEVKTSTPTR